MTNEEMRKVALKASVFALVSITLMLLRSATKHIMITDAAGIQIDRGETDNAYNLLVDGQMPNGKENTLIIPLSKSVSSDNIILEDGYVDHELRIYLDSREEGFYLDTPVLTDLDIITDAVCFSGGEAGSICLQFTTDDIYANESTLTESNTIEVRFFEPSDKYEHIVAVDVAAGGNDGGVSNGALSEKNITLETALLLKEIADKDRESGIKLYFTRLSDKDVNIEKRQALIEDCGADLFVQLSVSESEDSNDNGIACFYNDRFFLRDLSNAGFADIMERGCASATGAQALGVFPSEDDLLLQGSKVASARVSLGYITGSGDCSKLSDSEYQQKLAEGVYNSILKAFEVTE